MNKLNQRQPSVTERTAHLALDGQVLDAEGTTCTLLSFLKQQRHVHFRTRLSMGRSSMGKECKQPVELFKWQ